MGASTGNYNSSPGQTSGTGGKSSGGYGLTPSTYDNPYGTGDNTGASIQGSLTYNDQPVGGGQPVDRFVALPSLPNAGMGGGQPVDRFVALPAEMPMMDPNQARFNMRQQNRQMRFNNLPPEQQARRQDRFMTNQQNRYDRFQARNMQMPYGSPGGKGSYGTMPPNPPQGINQQNMFDY